MDTNQSGQPIAVGASTAGQLFEVSASTWRRMHAAGLVPSPVRIGPGNGSPRWVVDTLRDWAAAGCPTRYQFESEKSLAMGGGDGSMGAIENCEPDHN